MLIIYVSFIFFDGILLSGSHVNRITRELPNPDFWSLANLTSIEFQDNNSTQLLRRYRRSSLHHHVKREKSHSKNIVDVDEVDSRRLDEKKRSTAVVDSDREKAKIVASDDDLGNFEQKKRSVDNRGDNKWSVDSDDDKTKIGDSDDDEAGNTEKKRSVDRREDHKWSTKVGDSDDDEVENSDKKRSVDRRGDHKWSVDSEDDKSKIGDSDDDEAGNLDKKRSVDRREDHKWSTKVGDSDDDEAGNSEKKRSVQEGHHKWLKSNRKRGLMKRKHHSKRVAKKDTATKGTDATPGREKRSSVRDKYVGDTLFALELFLLFIPLACVTVVVLSLLHVCWSRTCKNRQDAQWASEVEVCPAVDVPPKQKMTDIVSELVTNDLMACGDAISRRVKLERMTGQQPPPARKKSLHKRVPVKDTPDSSDPPKSTSSLYIVRPLLRGEGAHFPSTATFDSHVVGDTRGRRSLRLKAFINHHHHHHRKESDPSKNEGKGGLKGKGEESPRRPTEGNKRRLKSKSNPVEESSLSSSFQYPNYYHQDNEFYDMEH